MKEYAEKAKFWHYIWKEDGRKRSGVLADIRRKTRAQYRYAIRRVKKDYIQLRNNRMGEAVANNNDRMLWNEVKKMSSTNNKLPKGPSIIININKKVQRVLFFQPPPPLSKEYFKNVDPYI